MPMISFSQKDILRSKLVEPAWYRVQIDEITEKPSKDGGSTNYIIEGKILFNSDTGSKDFNGVPTPYWNFNSKALGFMIGFFAALDVDIEADARYELKSAEGKELDVYIENDVYNGAMVNRINHKYRKPRA